MFFIEIKNYEPVNKNISKLDFYKKILKLDGYDFIKSYNKENFDIRINYYSNKKTWNTFFFDISSDAIHGLTERKSFKASSFDF